MVTQSTAKTTNSEKAIYFVSLMSCSINKLKSHMLFTCINSVFRFHVIKKNFLREILVEGLATAMPPFLYDPEIASLSKLYENFIYLSRPAALLLAADGEVNKL